MRVCTVCIGGFVIGASAGLVGYVHIDNVFSDLTWTENFVDSEMTPPPVDSIKKSENWEKVFGHNKLNWFLPISAETTSELSTSQRKDIYNQV